MHPKQTPIVVALSMALGVLLMSTALVMLAGMHPLGLGMMLLLALCSIMLGRYLPSSDARGLLDVYQRLEDMNNKLTILMDKMASAPLDNGSIGRQITTIAAHLAKIERYLVGVERHAPAPRRIQKQIPSTASGRTLQRKVIDASKSQ